MQYNGRGSRRVRSLEALALGFFEDPSSTVDTRNILSTPSKIARACVLHETLPAGERGDQDEKSAVRYPRFGVRCGIVITKELLVSVPSSTYAHSNVSSNG